MEIAVGRAFFFNVIAKGLLELTPGCHTKTVALKILDPEKKFTNEDRLSLAEAICYVFFKTTQYIHFRELSNLAKTSAKTPLIIDSLGSKTHETIKMLVAEIGTCEEVVLVGYSQNDMPTLVELPFELIYDDYLIERAIRELFIASNKEYDSLAPVRFIQKGFNAFKDFAIFNESIDTSIDDPIVLERFCLNISRNWMFDGVKVNVEDVYGWVKQFQNRGFTHEACQILLYLKREGFVTQNAVKGNLLALFKEHVDQIEQNVTAIKVQPTGKSESLFSYPLSVAVKFEDVGNVLSKIDSPGVPIELVCFDDVIVSGGSVLKYLFNSKYNPHSELLKETFIKKTARLTIISSHADQKGISKIINDPRCNNAVSVKASCIVDDSHRIFSANSFVITDKSRIEGFNDFCQEIGKKITSSVPPLGWNGAQWCIVFDYSVPNGTIPIVWASSQKNKWHALFPRKRTPAK